MAKRLLDYDPLTGITQYFEYDPLTKKTTIQSVQDCTRFIELNKARQNTDGYFKNGVKQEFLHAAQIPNIIIEKWMKEEGINLFNPDDWPKIRKKLNDPEWKYLRTYTGKI